MSEDYKQISTAIDLVRAESGINKNTSERIGSVLADALAYNESSNAQMLTAAKCYADSQVASLSFVKVVASLPATGLPNVQYLLSNGDSSSDNLFTEYLWVNEAWEKLGEKRLEVDLTPYALTTDVLVRVGEEASRAEAAEQANVTSISTESATRSSEDSRIESAAWVGINAVSAEAQKIKGDSITRDNEESATRLSADEAIALILDAKQDTLTPGRGINITGTEISCTLPGGEGGTSDYNSLENLPSLGGVELKGDKRLSDYNLASFSELDATRGIARNAEQKANKINYCKISRFIDIGRPVGGPITQPAGILNEVAYNARFNEINVFAGQSYGWLPDSSLLSVGYAYRLESTGETYTYNGTGLSKISSSKVIRHLWDYQNQPVVTYTSSDIYALDIRSSWVYLLNSEGAWMPYEGYIGETFYVEPYRRELITTSIYTGPRCSVLGAFLINKDTASPEVDIRMFGNARLFVDNKQYINAAKSLDISYEGAVSIIDGDTGSPISTLATTAYVADKVGSIDSLLTQLTTGGGAA